MLLFLLAYLLLCLYRIKIIPPHTNRIFDDYISKDATASMKGVFVFLVFFSHFNSYANYTNAMDLMYVRVIKLIGQPMVSMFMFYSGFGVMESIRKKGKEYIQRIPQKRILSTWIKFACIVAVYVLIAWLIGKKITFKQTVFSFFCLDSVGNSSWYIFTILWLYLITYISFTLCGSKRDYRLGAYLSVLLTGGYVLIMQSVKPFWWYDTALCYSVGVLYSIWRRKIEKLINKGSSVV